MECVTSMLFFRSSQPASQPNFFDAKSDNVGQCMLSSRSSLCVHLEVVGAHEQIGNALSHDPHDPLIKVFGLALSCGVGNLGLNQSCQTVDLQQGTLLSVVM